MSPAIDSRSSRRTFAFAAALSLTLSLGLHLLAGDVNLNMADEGYLWYGVLRVLEGEVPFRDFQSYDPARYYWCAAWSPVFGSGILGVRASLAILQALGMTLGLLVVRRLVSRDVFLVPAAFVLLLWSYPRHKVVEPAVALAITWSIVRLVESPTRRRFLEAGLCAGLAACFGRNHGVYAVAACLAASGFLAWRRATPGLGRMLLSGGAGVLLGYAPMLLALVLVPGFGAAFVGAVLDVSSKGTNIPRSWPWPWRMDWSGPGALALASEAALSLAFLAPVVVPTLGLLRVLRRGAAASPALVGALLTGTIYVHHVAVRSDAPHLAQSIHPLLIATIALWPGARACFAASLGLLLVTVLATFQKHTPLQFFAPWKPAPVLTETEVAGDTLRLLPPQARYVRALESAVAARLAPEDEILVVPTRPTLYPLLGKHAPIADIYLLWQATEEEQDALIEALDARRVRWVLVIAGLVDDDESSRFEETHPLVMSYLEGQYERLPTPGLRADHTLFRRRDG